MKPTDVQRRVSELLQVPLNWIEVTAQIHGGRDQYEITVTVGEPERLGLLPNERLNKTRSS